MRWIVSIRFVRGCCYPCWYLAQSLHQLEFSATICSLAPRSHQGCPSSHPLYFCSGLLPGMVSLEQMAGCMNFSCGKGMNTVFQPWVLCQFVLLNNTHIVRRNFSVSIWPVRSQMPILWMEKKTYKATLTCYSPNLIYKSAYFWQDVLLPRSPTLFMFLLMLC